MHVFIFHGAGSRFANAVFSTRSAAEAWIARHGLTGLLTEYEMDAPAFDRRLNDEKLPAHVREALLRGEPTTIFAQQHVDGARHSHYFHGLGEESPGYLDAVDRWHRAHGQPDS